MPQVGFAEGSSPRGLEPEPQEKRGDPGPSLLTTAILPVPKWGHRENCGLWLDVWAGFWGQGQLKASTEISEMARGLNCPLKCLSLPAGLWCLPPAITPAT